MQRHVTLLSCLAVIAASAQEVPKADLQASTPSSCTVAGTTWTSGFMYLSGRSGVYPSIYAQCDNGVATCYRQTRQRDSTRDQIPCDETEIHEQRRRLGIYVPDQNNIWPQGVVCYSYSFDFTEDQREVINEAMNEYHRKTIVRFITLDECKSQYESDTDVCDGCQHAFEFIQHENSCHATLGYSPMSKSIVNLGDGCIDGDDPSTAIHELGHVLSLVHEHTHPDREVVVIPGQILVSPDNYAINDESTITAYDRQSTMHYGRYAGLCVPKDPSINFCDVFQEPGQNCVVATDADCDDSQDNSFGSFWGLSDSDVATIAKIYGGSARSQTPPTASPPTTQPPPPPTPPPQTARPPTQKPSTQIQTQSIRPQLTTAPSTSASEARSGELDILGTTYKIARGDDGLIRLQPLDGQRNEIVLSTKDDTTTSTNPNTGAKTSTKANRNTNSVRQSFRQ